jgi:DNA-directed RNA polymerase specialized sigma24 family protein
MDTGAGVTEPKESSAPERRRDLEATPESGGDRLPSPRVTPAMKGALSVGVIVFALGALWKLLLISWLGIAATVMALAGSILVRTGGLEPRTFGACLTAAIVLDVVLLLGILAAAVATRVKPELTNGPGRAYLRHPARVTAVVLAIALLAVTAAGWKRSPYFPYPLATIVVLASAYYFLLLVVLYTGSALYRLWPHLRTWGHSTAYRTGLLTATLILLGLGGLALGEADWAPAPLHRLASHLGLDQAPAAGELVDAQLTRLCVGADELAPGLASAAAAPSCRILGEGGGANPGELDPRDDCFTRLEKERTTAQRLLTSQLAIDAHDANDIAAEALLRTCTREPLPRDLRAYFFQIVRNGGVRAAVLASRSVPCGDAEAPAPSGCLMQPGESGEPAESSEPAEYREAELALVWQYAQCVLSDQEARVLRSRLVDNLSFREVGEPLALTEEQARSTFHNAIKKLRSRLRGCLRW